MRLNKADAAVVLKSVLEVQSNPAMTYFYTDGKNRIRCDSTSAPALAKALTAYIAKEI